MARRRHRLTGSGFPDVFDAGDQVAHLAGSETIDRHPDRRAHAYLFNVMDGTGLHEAQPRAGFERAVDDADRTHHAAVLVIGRVENQRPQRGLGVALGCGDPRNDGLEELVDPFAGLGRDVEDLGGGDAEDGFDFRGTALRVGGGQVDLVEHGHDLEVVLDGLITVGQGLGLDAL